MADKPPFSFEVLWRLLLSLNSNDSDIIYPYQNRSVPALRLEAASEVVSSNYQLYEIVDVWVRVVLWRLPLIALWLTMVLPPFEWHTWIFSLLHVVASPLDAISSLLYLLDLVKHAVQQLKRDVLHAADPEDLMQEAEREALLQRYNLQAVARIIDAFDQWGLGSQARETMQYLLTSFPAKRGKQDALCERAATSIAADRKASFLPTFGATLVFLEQLSKAFWQTVSEAGSIYDEKNDVSAGILRAPHNIAFGTLFFWLPLLVMLVSLVGGPNTSFLVPNVLDNLRTDTHELYCIPICEKHDCRYKLPNISKLSEARWLHGGFPVYQRQRFDDMNDHDRRHRMFFWKSLAVALLVVTFPAACAICVSCLTPSFGFGIRPMIQLSFWILWLVSLALDRAIHKVCEAKTGYWVTFAKDTVFFILTVVTLTLTAMGFLNSAGSWSQWNATYNDRYISFVQEPYVFNLIKTRLTILFPALVGSTFAIEILLLLYILFAYRSSFEILWQRDITRT